MSLPTLNVNASTLIKSILDMRFSDINIQEELCRQLLIIAETNHDTYALCFANLYLFDAVFAHGDFEEARFYLLRTQSLCEQYKYEDLLMVFHNLAGLYYQDVFDEHSALHHYLNGLDLAQKLCDPILESKIYNNLGICFHRRNDYEGALYYFNSACETMKGNMTEDVRSTTISFLCNAAEINQTMKRIDDSAAALDKAQKLYTNSEYSCLRLKSAWCGHYAVSGEREKSIMIAKELVDEGLIDIKHVQLVISVYFEVFGHMIQIDCKEYAYQYLSLLEANCGKQNIGDYYHYISCKMQYYECYGTSAECEQAYKDYYETYANVNEVNNSIHVENVLQKIDLAKTIFEINSLRKENIQLENMSHIDELTQLYNRRYLTKLQSKVRMGEQHITMGYVMLDVDYFKEYNDHYGHFKGDKALQCVAGILKNQEDDHIYASRYGGDEFLVLFVNHSREQIVDYIEKVRAELKHQKIPHVNSRCAPIVTLSIGFSNHLVSNQDMMDEVLECADEALYQAKEDGRNCYRYKSVS